ncbi:ABC transporter permease [Clostridium sp. P21]|uniref:ABC transporter permease n=1 Tax=Clostridium muellerianum TaxID=2716538 RepID=A0A7Y0EP75_9CLOT|nr:ABC transporter permease [Clostridium muellerianum]NMM65950.1 ABC transporter permease [Clostridium muellerianum]
MIINKKIKRTILENKSQYFGSLALIIISCILFTMFNLLSDNMTNIISFFEEKYVQEDAYFTTNRKLNNISELESKFNMKIEESSSFDYSVSKDKVIRVFTENTKVNIPAIIQGKTLIESGILIDPAYAKANKLKEGDTINIYDKNFRIAGFMSLPNYIYPLKSEGDILANPNNFGVAVIKKSDYSAINKGNIFYSIKFNGDKKDLENRMVQFKEYLRSQNNIITNWMNSSANLRITFVKTKLNGVNEVSSFIPTAILLLSCILTGIVMWRMLKRESPVIGTLYALGYNKKQIQNHYLRYPLFIAIAGGIIGTIIGIFTLRPMINLMISYFNMPVGTIRIDIKYMAVSIFMPGIFLTAAGYLVVNKALKSSPLELMRGGRENNKVGFLERSLKLDKLKFSTKFKIREQLRSIPRSIFLLLGVTIATMLLLMGFASKSSMDYVMKEGFEKAFKYNYQYIFNSIHQGTSVKGEAFSELPFTLKSNNKINLAVYGISPNSESIVLEDKHGNRLSTNKVIITRPLSDKLNAKIKDTIKIIGKVDSKEYSITVDSIAETYIGNYIYMPLSQFNSMLNYKSGSYFGLWSKDKLDIPENQLLTTLSVDDMKNAVNSMTQPIQLSVGTIAFMSFIIGLIVIYVVTFMIVEENKENISLMKILGYRKKEIYSMILNSSWSLVVIGYILGIPMLLVSLGAMLKSLTKEMSISLPLRINYIYLIIGFLIIQFTYEISKALSKKKVDGISMNEILKSRFE